MCSKPVRRQRGLTLIELVMFIVIIGIALVGILQVLRFTTHNSADPVRRKQALMIAEGLLEEVQLAKFTYCDPGSGNTDPVQAATECLLPEAFGQEPGGQRPFDNINDYVAQANKASAAFDVGNVLADANGIKLDVTGYTALLTIAPAPLGPLASPLGAAGTSADTDVLRITIEVSYDDQKLVLDGYRTRYAPNHP
jgi:MSHA pilin protein MshD